MVLSPYCAGVSNVVCSVYCMVTVCGGDIPVLPCQVIDLRLNDPRRTLSGDIICVMSGKLLT